jgi:hypothetical protein
MCLLVAFAGPERIAFNFFHSMLIQEFDSNGVL